LATGNPSWPGRLWEKAAQAGIEEAVENAVRDEAFDAALGAVGVELAERAQRASFGPNAVDAFEASMTAADIASTLDRAADVAEAARKINKARKIIKRVR
jgi:hypothetical protein